MHLNFLVDRLLERLKGPLPGAVAHEPLRAVSVGSLKPTFGHAMSPRPGSVLILLYEDDDVIKFPLIKRPVYVGTHSGQISLPGGKAEAGEDSFQTALREGEEEIGIDQNQIQVIGKLSNFLVIPSNFIITPVIGVVDQPPIFKPDPHEVASILMGSIQDLIKDEAVKKKEILVGGQYRMSAPHFEIEGEVVWGATAMMLNEFRLMLREILVL